MSQAPLVDSTLVAEVKQLIQSAKQRAVVAVNVELTLLYWQVGKRIADEVLNGERAEYGKQVIDQPGAAFDAWIMAKAGKTQLAAIGKI